MLILDAEDWVACLPRDHPPGDPRTRWRSPNCSTIRSSCAPLTARAVARLLDGDGRARWQRPPTIAAVAATYEEETTTHRARAWASASPAWSAPGSTAGPGIVYVPITDRPRSYTALAWNPAAVSHDAAALIRQVHDEWSFGEWRSTERPATYS